MKSTDRSTHYQIYLEGILDERRLRREQMDDELFHYAPDRLNELSNVLAVFSLNPP